MIKKLLYLFGYEIKYYCEWGYYSHRYDGIDFTMCRPVHRSMSVAPPWAKRKIMKIIKWR
jgi:hypothetical protein